MDLGSFTGSNGQRLLTCRSAIESVIAGELRIIKDGGSLTPATEIGTRGVKSVTGQSRAFSASMECRLSGVTAAA